MEFVRREYRESDNENSGFGKLRKRLEISDEELVLHAKIFLVAGMETLARTVGSSLYFAHKYPNYLKRMRKEVILMKYSF